MRRKACVKDIPEMTGRQKREIMARLKDFHDPTRYAILSQLCAQRLPGGLDRMWFNTDDDIWCTDINMATLFKRRKYAEAVRKSLGKDRGVRVVKLRKDRKTGKRNRTR